MDFAQFVGKGFGPEWKGLLFRREYKEFDDLVEKSKKWFSRIFPGAKFIESKGDYKWIFPWGEKLFFRVAKKISDYDSYHGHGYPWIGWEELTSWPDEELYIAMLSICRSAYPGMPRHYRATCNPWGVGHHWVKARFIDPMPRGVVITDEQGRERVAIHGEIWENTHLLENDPEYLKNLQAQSGAKKQAWLYGDWDIVAGGMFGDVWDADVHIVEPFEAPKSWRIDRSFDWGSARPYSVGWWAESDGCDIKLPDGTTRSTQRGDLFRIAELYGWTGKANEGTRELAVEVARKIKEHDSSSGHRVHAGPADTMIFDTENGKCIADDMARIGVSWTRADKRPGSRINGWELLRERLKNSITKEGPGLYVFNTCRQFIRTVPILPRDEAKPDDIDTEAEDHCLHGDTLIVTSQGEKPIRELVGTKGFVLTAGGYWTEYKNCRLTRKRAEVFRVTFEDGSHVICTGDHKILTSENQWKEAREWKSKQYHQHDRNFRASRIICAEDTSRERVSDFIARYGNITTDPYPSDFTSTILTETEQTIKLKILSLFPPKSIPKGITHRAIATRILPKLKKRPVNGTAARRVSSGIKNNIKKTVSRPCLKKSKSNVGIAAKSLLVEFVRFIARIIAKLHTGERPGQTIQNANVSSAEKSSSLINTMQTRPARAVAVQGFGVKRVEKAGFADVYCLDANITHCFVLANGVIVHNCADETRYRILAKSKFFSGGHLA